MSKEKIFLHIWCFLFLLFCTSCVATQQDILALTRQIQTLNSQIHKLEGVREDQADVGAEIENVRQDLQRLSGELEEYRHLVKHTVERDTLDQDTLNARLTGLEKKITQLYKHLDLDEHLLGPQRQQLKDEPLDLGTATPQPSVEELPTSTEETLYDEALVTYREGKYLDAITAFKNLIKKYPKSDLCDNAQFWIGEAYMALENYEQAIHAYHEVITEYPGGNKVPNAMLKQALAFIEAKDNVAAKIVLKNLIRKYPDSDEARLSEAKLKTIK